LYQPWMSFCHLRSCCCCSNRCHHKLESEKLIN
jgi:hypothetical protein